MVKKTDKTVKRDLKGQFKKGCKGGPGRRKGEVKDIVCSDGKKRSPADLVDDLLSTYSRLGSNKFLYEWVLSSKRNLTKFLDILFKFAPPPEQVIAGDEFKPLTVHIKSIPTDEHTLAMEKNIKLLTDENREQRSELLRLRSIFSSHDIKFEEIEHTPIREALPEHGETEDDEDDEKDHSDRR